MQNIADQLTSIMQVIWDDTDKENYSVTIRALASYARSHARRNHENVFDVIDILFRDNTRTIKQRAFDEANPGDVSHYLVDVQFDDESQCLVICSHGIGNGIEFIS